MDIRLIKSSNLYLLKISIAVMMFLTITVCQPVFAENTGLFDWKSNDMFVSGTYSSVTFGNNIFVAVGHGGMIKTSQDGANWIFRASGTTSWLRRVYWNGSLFVAVGYSYSANTNKPITGIATSNDGVNWKATELETANDIRLSGIAWDENRFLAVGQGGVCTSYDGIKWNTSNKDGGFEDVVWANGKFTAVGYNYRISATSGSKSKIVNSTDGIIWTPVDTTISNTLNRIIWTGNQYIAVGRNGYIVTSSDGNTWTQSISGADFELSDIAFNGKIFLAGGWDSQLLFSKDAVHWEQIAVDIQRVYGIAWGNGKCVITGLPNFPVIRDPFLYSDDGLYWKVNTKSKQYIPKSIGYDKNKELFIAYASDVKENNVILSSNDGLTWNVGTNSFNLKNINSTKTATNGVVYVLIEEGKIITSNDKINWNGVNFELQSDLNSVIWSGKQFVAVGYDGQIITSSDGFKWESRHSGKMIYRDIAYNGQKYMAVGDAGEVAVSTDGINWDKQPHKWSGLKRIIFDGTRFIIGGDYGTIFTSIDGERWDIEIMPLGGEVEDIVYAKGLYLVMQGNGVFVGTLNENKLAQSNNTDSPKQKQDNANSTPNLSEITVIIDGVKIKFDQPPIVESGRTLVPMRAIFEAMGATVSWDGETKTITATKGNSIITMQIDKKNINAKGNDILLDVAPKIINNRTLVPVRAVAESLKANVNWNGDTKTINIITVKENISKLNAPTGVWAKIMPDGKIGVGWDNVPNAECFYVYGCPTKDGAYVKIRNAKVNSYKWQWHPGACVSKSNPVPGYKSYYKITSVKSGFESDFSDVAFIQVPN